MRHVIIGAARQNYKLQEKYEEKGERKTENGDFLCAMGVHVRDGMADLYRPL